MDQDLRLVYMTARSPDQAKAIGRELIEARLAACINILPSMTSLYWWDGQVEEGQECVVIAKTEAVHVAALTDKVKSLHSDKCPCVVSLTVNSDEGNSDFLNWIRAETATEEGRS